MKLSGNFLCSSELSRNGVDIAWDGNLPAKIRKVLDILNSWEKNKNAFGKYHHQCLIYARLLQLHMDLDYLPHILIIPISSLTGKDVYLALFWDYPKECKQAIESFKWSRTLPKPTMKVRGRRPFLTEGRVDRSLPMRCFLDMDASAGELLGAFGISFIRTRNHLNLDSENTITEQYLKADT